MPKHQMCDGKAVVDRGEQQHEAHPEAVAVERHGDCFRRVYGHAEPIFVRFHRVCQVTRISTVMNKAADTTSMAAPITDSTTESAKGAMAGSL